MTGRLARVIDGPTIVKLSTLAGGRTLTIPQHYRDDTALARLVGTAIAFRLVNEFGGERVYVPRGPSPHNSRGKSIDPKLIARLIAKGPAWTNERIADTLNCTPRTISNKRAQLRRAMLDNGD